MVPKHVIMIVGMNKVVNDVEDGIKRVRNFASPPNTLRLGLKTPCSMTGRCGDCYGDTCICSQIVVTRRQSAMMKDRVKVILVGESLGLLRHSLFLSNITEHRHFIRHFHWIFYRHSSENAFSILEFL